MAVIATRTRRFDARFERSGRCRPAVPRATLRGFAWGVPIAAALWAALAGLAALLF